ncbi:TonB-dependent receptor [Sorangium sp. So ce296]|uniref:TonB-dependent receptor plug domain-containing protein n=1 Tax=Sorangium sp. So ce296 TaxID=3133296 RepID=UPI003F5EDCBB
MVQSLERVVRRRRSDGAGRWLVLAAGSALAAAPAAVAEELRGAGAEQGGGRAAVATAPLEVRVEGERARAPAPPKDRSVAGSVLTRDRLTGAGLEAADVLRTQPGVQVTESGGFGGPATAAIRGATAAQTPVYLAGVRLNDDVAGTADLSLVPLWLVERVEIYRGNAPIEADRLGPGGAIFFEPRRPSRTTAGVGAMAGSFGARRGWAFAGVSAGPVSSIVGVSAEAAANRYAFVDDRGTLFDASDDTVRRRQNADVRAVDAWALARFDLGHGATVDVIANGLDREQGVPRLALLPSRQARGESRRALASVVTRVPFGGEAQHTLEARTSFIEARSEFHDPLLELALLTRELRLAGRRLEQTLGATLYLSDRLTVRPMLSVAREGISREPDDIPLARARRTSARGAVSAELRLGEWLALRALGSGECHATGADPGRPCDVLAPSGRVGVEAGSGRVRLLATVGRYLRVPTLGEVYGISGVVHGNAELEPESSVTLEAGIRAQTRRGAVLRGAYIDAFVFGRASSGLIAYARSGQGYVAPYNVDRARVLGAELLTGIEVTSFLRAEVAATFLDPRDTTPQRTTANDVLPFRPRLVVAPRLRADWKPSDGAVLSGASGELRAVYQSSRYADPAGLGVIAEQATVDVEAEATWLRGHLAARARVADLLDARRTDVVGYPLPGRSVFLTLESTW